jgi:hypothetical protein
MFSETKKYKLNGHFFFKKGDDLAVVSKDVPEMPGIFYVLRLAQGNVDLVYIGQSGTILQSGEFNKQLLRSSFTTNQDGIKRQEFFDSKVKTEKIDALDIYWFVTMDNKSNQDLPGYVEGILMQRYFEVYGKLPPWNKEF